MKIGSDCEVLLGRNRLWWKNQEHLKTCLDTEAAWLYRLFSGATVGGYAWEGLCVIQQFRCKWSQNAPWFIPDS